jgi:hypothetical protein
MVRVDKLSIQLLQHCGMPSKRALLHCVETAKPVFLFILLLLFFAEASED